LATFARTPTEPPNGRLALRLYEISAKSRTTRLTVCAAPSAVVSNRSKPVLRIGFNAAGLAHSHGFVRGGRANRRRRNCFAKIRNSCYTFPNRRIDRRGLAGSVTRAQEGLKSDALSMEDRRPSCRSRSSGNLLSRQSLAGCARSAAIAAPAPGTFEAQPDTTVGFSIWIPRNPLRSRDSNE
jgi:hypothetical protein